MKHLENTHDLRLPVWGPYTKNYMGVSHIPDVQSGLRFDLSVFPGFYHGRLEIPNVKFESGYHPWEAAPDLTYYCHRHELEWKDRVYVDISFSYIDEKARLIRCECVNNTELAQTLVLHYMASINFPPLRPGSDEAIRPARISLPEGALWIGALEYTELRYATPRPTDNLMPDGIYRGEVRDHGFVDGNGVGRGFGQDPGDYLQYMVTVTRAISDAVLLIRCRLLEKQTSRFRMAGLVERSVSISGDRSFQLIAIPVGAMSSGVHKLEIISEGGAPVDFDGFVLCEAEDKTKIVIEEVSWNAQAELLPGPVSNSLRIRYEQIADIEYGLAWNFDQFAVRQFYTDDLERLLPRTVHNHVSAEIHDVWAATRPVGHFTNVFLRPIPITSQSYRIIYGLVCCGSSNQVDKRLSECNLTGKDCDDIYGKARRNIARLNGNTAGKPYEFSQEKMAATTLTNVVYPIYIKGTYIRNNTPGRWWDSLYTWDSGFIGIGLLELDIERAIDCLNAYVTEPGDQHAAFIHHGSPVPVQFYLFLEIWNRKHEKELLKYFYPRLKQYHEFLVGKSGSSTTRILKSNLLKTWDYFYNSGGWDDYPPQIHVHREKLTSAVTPVVITAQCIRTAKILKMAALALGCHEDIKVYDEDIRVFKEALQTFAWDEKDGYFSYVMHDDDGNPTGFLRYENGVNFNMGLDGAYPLVAGICTPDQEMRLFYHLQNPHRLWTAIGLSTVDQSAPYYRVDGYWNGAVWMPHQWFFWKACLDLGQPDFAWKIARTGLEVWRREVEYSYNCYEHFIVTTGRGAGWHHFGGLSTPVLSWYGAYFRPGRLTCGFDVWLNSLNVSDNHVALEASLRTFGYSGRTLYVISSLNPEYNYSVTWNDKECTTQRLFPGVFNICLPCSDEGILQIVRM